MGLFGNLKRPPMPTMFGMDETQTSSLGNAVGVPSGGFGPRPEGIEQAAAYTGPAKKGGLFGSGLKLLDIAGALSDGVQSAYGGGMPYASMMVQKRQSENALKRLAAQQQAELQQQIGLYDYKRANPMPQNDSFTRALAAAGIQPGTPEYVVLAKKRAEMLTNPVQLVPDGMGGYTAARPYGGGEEDIPQAPVGDLTPYNGGPMPQASGGFR